jgi:hypothetical protein
MGEQMISCRKYTWYFTALLTIAVMSCCAKASAPPVDLPAPVTGQIDVGAPDAEGKATITGNEGAVTGGSTVLAINESAVEASLWQVTDFLFSKAYAQTFPGVCDLEGRACAEAEADGSFTMQIDAVVGDQIILVLISSDGEEISERVTVSVPAGSGIQACGSGFEGSLVAIANVGGVVYSLFEGSTDSANKLIIGGSEFQIPGCYAKSIAAIEESTGSILIAAASDSDNKLWIGRWNGDNLTMGLTYATDIAPYKAAFAGDPAEVILAGAESSINVEAISVSDGSTTHSLTTNNTDETDVAALNIIGPFADGGYLGIVVARDSSGYYLTFFLASSLSNVTSNPGEIFLSASAMGIVGDDPVVADASLGSDSGEIRFIISDRQSIEPAFRSIRVAIGVQPIMFSDNASSFDGLSIDSAYATEAVPNTFTYPRSYVQFSSSSAANAYVLTDDSYLWRIENCFSPGAMVQTFISLTAELPDPIAIAIDDTGASLAGGNAAGTTADLSSYIP